MTKETLVEEQLEIDSTQVQTHMIIVNDMDKEWEKLRKNLLV